MDLFAYMSTVLENGPPNRSPWERFTWGSPRHGNWCYPYARHLHSPLSSGPQISVTFPNFCMFWFYVFRSPKLQFYLILRAPVQSPLHLPTHRLTRFMVAISTVFFPHFRLFSPFLAIEMTKFGIDIQYYEQFFIDLQRNKPDMSILGETISYDDAILRARELSEPKNPVNPNKLAQIRSLSTHHLFKNGSRKVLKRIRDSNIDAFFTTFPHLTPPTWFIVNCNDLKPLVDRLLAVNISPLDFNKPPKRPKKSFSSPKPAVFQSSTHFIKPNYEFW